jgi:hypothetical protein
MASTTKPDAKAVQRQPNRASAVTTSGVSRPPSAMPMPLMLSASERRRRNHVTMATLIGR